MATKSQEKPAAQGPAVNEVRLVGRVSNAPERKELPSGTSILSLRLIVDRPAAAVRGTQRVDVLDCVVWTGRLLRSVAGWSPGDLVEVAGSVRRRFYQGRSGAASRVEIEVQSARLLRRAQPSASDRIRAPR